MSDQIEVERKWMLTGVPNMFTERIQHLVQAYLFTEPGELRIRSDGVTNWLTAKSDGLVARAEWEQEIPDWLFAQLLATTSRVIEKTRYTFWMQNHKWELDVYAGKLERLVVVEIESVFPASLSELEQSAQIARLQAIELPSCFGSGVEVTADKRYKNKNLALYGMPDEEDKA